MDLWRWRDIDRPAVVPLSTATAAMPSAHPTTVFGRLCLIGRPPPFQLQSSYMTTEDDGFICSASSSTPAAAAVACCCLRHSSALAFLLSPSHFGRPSCCCALCLAGPGLHGSAAADVSRPFSLCAVVGCRFSSS
jgi:hypothetical protein